MQYLKIPLLTITFDEVKSIYSITEERTLLSVSQIVVGHFVFNINIHVAFVFHPFIDKI